MSVDEILVAISISLGERPIEACGVSDSNGDGKVTVEELITMVDAALSACGVRPTPTATPTPQPPDLTIKSINGWSQGLSCADDERKQRARICVANAGRGTASDVDVSLLRYHGSVAADFWTIPRLKPAQDACLSIPVYDSIRVVVDPEDRIAESNESNNSYPYPLPTLTRGPSCTRTPTPTAEAACCEYASGDCGARVRAHDCFREGGVGYDEPFVCETAGCRASDSWPTPLPTATPAPLAPDLVAGPVMDSTFEFGGPMLVCVRNFGVAPSGAVELSIGNYWRLVIPSLEPMEQSCVQAARTTAGRLVVDPDGRIGESDETNNELTFDLDPPS